ncbi:MAG: adenylate/guanylate cyclase domain-containing protein, partial [Longimicrobiales bacterium]
MEGSVRRLAAVFFADIVGYTSLSSENEAAALRLIDVFHATLNACVAEHAGRLVKLIGDGALVEFGSSDAAVRAAIHLHEAFAAESGAIGIEARLRIGIHVGDVVAMASGDLFGDGVNTAARLQAEAGPGETVVSQDVWRHLRPRREFGFKSLGERRLQGIAGSVWLFSVHTATAGEEESGAARLPGRVPVARTARVFRISLLYLITSLAVLSAAALLREQLSLPDWVLPAAILVLAVGLVVIGTTAWVQSDPPWARRVGERPSPWDLDLRDLLGSIAARRMPYLTWPRVLLGGAVAFLFLFGIAAGYVYLQGGAGLFGPRRALASPAPGIAILPFDVAGTSADAAVWSEGMMDVLAMSLDGAGIRVIDPPSVIGRSADSALGDSATAQRIAREVGASYAMTGIVAVGGDQLSIRTRIWDAASGGSLGEARVTGPVDSIPRLTDRLVEQIMGHLATGGVDVDQPSIGGLGTTSVPALRAYLAGEQRFRQSRWQEARPAFEEAVELDPGFALGHYRLALTESWSALPHRPVMTRHGQEAYARSAGLPERQSLLLRANAEMERGLPQAIATLDTLTRKYPDDVEGWFLLGDGYYHFGDEVGVSDDAFRDAFRRAIELDDTFGPAYLHLIEDAVAGEDTARAKALIASYRRVDPQSPLLSGFDWAYSLAQRQLVEPVPESPASDAPRAARPASEPDRAARESFEGLKRVVDQARRAALTA